MPQEVMSAKPACPISETLQGMEVRYAELCDQLSGLLSEVRDRANAVDDECRALQNLISNIAEMFPATGACVPEERPRRDLEDIR